VQHRHLSRLNVEKNGYILYIYATRFFYGWQIRKLKPLKDYYEDDRDRITFKYNHWKQALSAGKEALNKIAKESDESN